MNPKNNGRPYTLSPNELTKRLVAVAKRIDSELRDNSPKCPDCGKPTAGLVPSGKTAAEVGLCPGSPAGGCGNS